MWQCWWLIYIRPTMKIACDIILYIHAPHYVRNCLILSKNNDAFLPSISGRIYFKYKKLLRKYFFYYFQPNKWGINLYLYNDPTWNFFQVQSTCTFLQVQTWWSTAQHCKIFRLQPGKMYRLTEPRKNASFDHFTGID